MLLLAGTQSLLPCLDVSGLLGVVHDHRKLRVWLLADRQWDNHAGLSELDITHLPLWKKMSSNLNIKTPP